MPTLAQAQLERDKIKALQAKQSFEDAYNATVSAEDTASAKRVINQLVSQHLQKLVVLWQQAIKNEQDETRVHYLMSDIAHDWLKELGQAVQQNLADADAGKVFNRAIKPKDLLTVSQWAERHRIIATGTNMPGPWRNENAPHAIEIMDSLSEHSPVEEVSFKKCSGVSGTEIINNWHGYLIHHVQNKDLMHTVPTLDLRDRVFNPHFKKMLKETPVLDELVVWNSRDASNSKEMTETLKGMQVHKIGANSPESARMLHIPYYSGDEISAYAWNLGGEGDTLTLFENRQKTFTRFKRLYVSTPTVDGVCRISDKYEKSDQRERYVPCPHCGHMHVLKFENFKFNYAPVAEDEKSGKKIVSHAWFECPECHKKIEEHQKNDMLDAGKWIPKFPKIKKRRGYHINAFYIKYGLGKTWLQIAQLWVDSQGDDAQLQAFVNTYLGETWVEPGEKVEAMSLLSRLESFHRIFGDDFKFVPGTIRIAAVDIQKNRFEATVADIEEGEELWTVQHLIIPADTAIKEEWVKLEEELEEWGVIAAGIDSGYNTSLVYEFCETHRWAIPLKGVPGMGRPLIEDAVKRKQRLRRRKKKAISPEPVGVDQGKGLIYARLKLDNPTTREVNKETGEIISEHREPRPGYIHFDNEPCFDDEYFAQLTAEKLITKKRAGREIQEWKKERPRNEALDCMVYLIATYRLAKDMPTIKRKMALIKNQPNTESSTNESTPQPTKRRRRGR